jgi:iron(III) transport system permease protein
VTRWRLAVAALLLTVFAVPLALPVLDLLRQPAAWRAWDDADRLIELEVNTALLVGGTVALALPAGVAGAVLLYRSDLPGRWAFRFLTVLMLFVPLPLFVSAWQAALGIGGLLPLRVWTTPAPTAPGVPFVSRPWEPWARGMPEAIWIHAVAGLPWVIWLVGQGLGWVERELEEDALLSAGPWRVLARVTLPRCRAAIGAAALWIALQAATEITVTDMMQVRTFAEEVYTQFVLPDRGFEVRDVLARAVAVSLPLVAGAALLILWTVRRWQRTLPPLVSRGPRLCLIPLGAARWPVFSGVAAVGLVLAGVPLTSLVWKAGLSGSPEHWSAAALGHEVVAAVWTHHDILLQSLLLAALAGTLAGTLALVAGWLALEGHGFRTGLLLLLAAAWALPGPVIGLGLKETIGRLMDGEDWIGLGGIGLARQWLYDGPSPLPQLWAALLRFFPCAVAVLWPVLRLLPTELRDAARVDGATPGRELRSVVWPLCARACLRAGGAVAVLSLGELSAGKLVETPGSQTFAHWVFNQMHYGVTNQLAAMCLVLLALVAAGGAAVALLGATRQNAGLGEPGA